MNESRLDKVRQLVNNRQSDLVVVLENVHDPHNIGAVMRTCDAVGIADIHLIISEQRVRNKLNIGKRTSAGARKWVGMTTYSNVQDCFKALREKGFAIWGSLISEESVGLFEMDLSLPTALVFGNEHIGLSREATTQLDGVFTIPQVGMVQSLNISVACAITCYEAFRQRRAAGMYDVKDWSDDQKQLFDQYKEQHLHRDNGARPKSYPS